MNWVCLHGLWDKPEYVPYRIAIIRSDSTFSGKNFASLGCPVLDHLATDGAGLAGGQVTVVAIGQVDANLASCLHLELVHGFLSLRNVQLIIIVAHNQSLLCFLWKGILSEESIFSFRSHSLTKVENSMNVNWRKEW